MATGGQPPFDHRKIPDGPDDVDTGNSHVGCLVMIAVIIGISLAAFLVNDCVAV